MGTLKRRKQFYSIVMAEFLNSLEIACLCNFIVKGEKISKTISLLKET